MTSKKKTNLAVYLQRLENDEWDSTNEQRNLNPRVLIKELAKSYYEDYNLSIQAVSEIVDRPWSTVQRWLQEERQYNSLREIREVVNGQDRW